MALSCEKCLGQCSVTTSILVGCETTLRFHVSRALPSYSNIRFLCYARIAIPELMAE